MGTCTKTIYFYLDSALEAAPQRTPKDSRLGVLLRVTPLNNHICLHALLGLVPAED